MIGVWSVPHTGTHFIKKLLEDAGLTVKARHFSGWVKTDELIICPIRDPQKTWKSWKARNRNQNFDEMWEIFNRAYKEQKMFILPIDTEDRSEKLKELSELLGVTLATDWKPVNASMGSTEENTDLEHIYKLDVVNKYYGKKLVSKKKSRNKR